jgi:hypothetical protein
LTPSRSNGAHSNGRSNGSKDIADAKSGRKPGTARKLSTVEASVAALPKSDLSELFDFWAGDGRARPPAAQVALRAQVVSWMQEPERVVARIGELGKRLGTLFDVQIAANRFECTIAQLVDSRELSYLSNYDLEASLAMLVRRGFLTPIDSREMAHHGARAWAVPAELGDIVLKNRRAELRGIFDTFTLKGYLDRLYEDPERARRTSPNRVRELYKLYANDSAAVARMERLPEGLRDLIEKVVLEFGGILPRGLFDRMETELPHWNGRRWAKILEESLVGTCQPLDLGRYGILHKDDSLIVFNEVSLAWLKRVAVPGDPDKPHDEASLGVDLVSNISRFLAFIIDHNVRFTVRGEIFKTTEKRILSDLIPNPGRELERSEVLDFIYGFCRERRLIESTGERTFALTKEGREWEPQSLEDKHGTLFQYVMEERDLGGELYHQMRMRRILIRFLKRVEPGTWYDIMYLPFLARNNYLSSLDELSVSEYFESRVSSGQYAPSEDLQRMAWNLVSWLRRRLYLLGIVDLGYDADERPVAMRLTRIGARMLGVSEPEREVPAVGNLVVTPDFEVVLFPTGDDGELTHDLDRFCEREKNGQLRHFRINERAVHRGLAEGMSLGRMFGTLEQNARTPVPRNVLHSIKDWARQAGLLHLDLKNIVMCTDPELMRRFAQDPGVRPYVTRRLDAGRIQLDKAVSGARLRSILRDLNYLVELSE